MSPNNFIKSFEETTIKDVPLVGGKNASLGEMYKNLSDQGIKVPNGFATTAHAYNYFLEKTHLKNDIRKILAGLNTRNVTDLAKRGAAVRKLIIATEFPSDLSQAILDAYEKLSVEYFPIRKSKIANRKFLHVAVRSSATAEDLPDASFAGQQETFLNISGEVELLLAVKKCLASLFTNRAISYRVDKGFDHFKIALSVGVQKMIRADLAASGVIFTIDTESGFNNIVLVNSIYGLGENIVQGKVNPDEFYVFKPTKTIISRSISCKKIKMIYSANPKHPVKNVKVPAAEQCQQSITDAQVLKLADWARQIEKHYGRAMDIEWALDGQDNQLYIIQARPETIHSVRDYNVIEEYILGKKGKVITTGRSVGNRIGAGAANRIMDISGIAKFKPGQVLVTDMTDPDWEPIMKIASAIVTDKGGRTCFSGDTLILTNQGFVTMGKITKTLVDKGIYTLSLNRKTLKIEWKKITDCFARQSRTIRIDVSQTGRHQNNYLRTTRDHKFIILRDRTLINEEINTLIKDKNMVLAADKIISFKNQKISKKLAYLWGCVYTDGSIYLSRTHGEVQFIQKQTEDKKILISTVKKYFLELFNKKLGICEKKITNGVIRGKTITGTATAFRCYSREIAIKFEKWREELPLNLLNCDHEANYYFLAGVIDGDGTFNKKNNRINIFCSNENLLQAVVISCLKLNILPQVTNNRNIYNIQIVDKVNELIKYSNRIKGGAERITNGTKFLSAKQLFYDIADLINYKGRIKPYVKNNLLLDKEKIKNNILPLLKGNIKKILCNILDADFVSMRAARSRGKKTEKVYNITTEDNHNYLVFTSKLTPIIVNNCHAAIVSRELGIPCIVGTNNVSGKVKTGEPITISCAQGDQGFVYQGKLPFKINKTSIKNLAKPKTKIMMNIGSPDMAFLSSFIPNDGVGLAREEFIISDQIKIHPLALLNYAKLKDKNAKKKIDELTAGYKDKKQYYIDKLAQGIAVIAAAFYPKDVIIRFSDFKTNEYANLIGGAEYEPIEGNPMIGWRGASRYYSQQFQPAFELECAAIKKARHDMKLTNLKAMVPFCRTVKEAKQVIKIIAANGLKQGVNGFELYCMVEIPSNVILAEEFAKLFDGFSIGSNDLTQLTLGVDRDSSLVSQVYDENNQAVKTLIKQVIQVAKKNKVKIGICGQAPSDFPEFAQFLVACGIDSISLNPDTVIKTTIAILETEKKLGK